MKKQIEDLGSIEITDNDYGPCTVSVRLVDGNVWMTQSQIARLFGVYEATVRNNLRAVFRSGILREGDVTHPSWNGQSGFGTLYGLEVIIYMSFRAGTPRANAFRKWIAHALSKWNHKNNFNNPVVVLVYSVTDKSKVNAHSNRKPYLFICL